MSILESEIGKMVGYKRGLSILSNSALFPLIYSKKEKV